MTLWAEPEAPMPAAFDDETLSIVVALASLPHLGPATLVRCLRAGELPAIWRRVCAGRAATVAAIAPALGVTHRVKRQLEVQEAAQAVDPSAALARNRQAGHVVAYGSPGYPARLLNDPEPPVILFARGDLSILDGPAVAVVGTRNATQAGREVAIDLGAGLAEAGVDVVSGLALGIDGAAHTGVLGAGEASTDTRSARAAPEERLGRPIGVIASGLDVSYPRRHAALHHQVAGRGCLVSETPLGIRPLPWRFPARNRIIAGLADAVVVVESRSAGGSMLTAADALARGITVLAVPGHPRSPAAAGANDLIADGASVARDVSDVLVAIGRGGTERSAVPEVDSLADTSGEQVAVLDAIGVEARSLDEVVSRSGLGLDVASAILAELEDGGRVVRTGSWYQRTGPLAARRGGIA